MVVRRIKPIVYFIIVAAYVVSVSLFVHFGMQLSPFFAFGLLLIFLAGPLLMRLSMDVLSYKEARHDEWWSTCALQCATFYANNGRLPNKSDEGMESLCLWLDDVRRLATSFGLTKNQAAAAKLARIEFYKEPKIIDFKNSFRGPVPYIVCSTWLTLVIAPVALFVPSAWVIATFSMIVCVLAVCVVCDLSARLIPYGWCLVLVALAYLYQLFAAGMHEATIALVVALAICVLIVLIDRFLRSIGKAGQIGTGDVYMLCGVLVAGFGGILYASLGMIVSYACLLCVGFIRGRANARTYVPFAPYLAVFAVIGMAIPQLLAAFA